MRKKPDPEAMKLSEQIQISKRAFHYLFSLGRPRVIYLYLIGNTIVQNVMPYVSIFFSAKLIDALYEGRPAAGLAVLVLLTLGSIFLLNLLGTWLSSGYAVASDEVFRSQGWDQCQKALKMAYASVEDADVAALRARIDMESQTGYNLWYLSECTRRLVASLTRIVMSLSLTVSFFLLEAVPFFMKAALAGGILLSLVCGVDMNRRTEACRQAFMESCVDANVFSGKYYQYIEHYSSGKDIRIYDMARSLLETNREKMEDLNLNALQMHWKICGLKAVDLLCTYLLRFGVYLLLLYGAFAGQVTVGSIARYVSCVMLLLGACSEMVSALQRQFVNNRYLKRLFSYLDIPNPMYQGTLTVEKRDDNACTVEFKDVSFCYPNSKTYALRHVNVKFQAGEKLAVVGQNGSGKTTFVKLLCRLYDPTEGEILLNGVDIRKYDYQEYMSLFSIVFQDFKLFDFTLGQNVAAGKRYDRNRVCQCLVQAGFGERLDAMPEGTESYLYKGYDGSGVELSGGEGQKIALARALYKDAPFLILDEPTSALDPVSEYQVYSRFSEIAGDQTAVYISHRLASCRFCDRIAVFDGGEIVQMGSHAGLLSQEGQYRKLWEAQAQYYTE